MPERTRSRFERRPTGTESPEAASENAAGAIPAIKATAAIRRELPEIEVLGDRGCVRGMGLGIADREFFDDSAADHAFHRPGWGRGR